MDPTEQRMRALFCEGTALQRCLSSFCADAVGSKDPIVSVILEVLQAPLQLQLTRVGLQMFQVRERARVPWNVLTSTAQGRDLTFPYMRMDSAQKEFLLSALSSGRWSVHDMSMIYRRKGASAGLAPLDVLEAICTQILSCKRYSDSKARVAVCNIVLQRVQASVPMSQSLQAELNARLFPKQEA